MKKLILSLQLPAYLDKRLDVTTQVLEVHAAQLQIYAEQEKEAVRLMIQIALAI